MRKFVGVLLVLCACGGDVAGNGDGSSGGGGNGGSTDGGATSTSPNSLEGNWAGYIESYKFPSGSDAIAFALTSSGGVVAGTVTYGTGTEPPPPTDPNAAYPPSIVVNPGELEGAGLDPATYIEGFRFAILGGTTDGSRVQIGTQSSSVFKAWCQLQPQTWGQGNDGGAPYECLPDWGTMATTGSVSGCSSTNPDDPSQTISYACEKRALCGLMDGTCVCDAHSCDVPAAAPDISFDMVFTPGALDGSITGSLGSENVHLKKVD